MAVSLALTTPAATNVHSTSPPIVRVAGEKETPENIASDGPVLTSQNVNAVNVVVLVEEDATEISDHNARVAALDEESGPLTSAERAASVEWMWKPGTGLVRKG